VGVGIGLCDASFHSVWPGSVLGWGHWLRLEISITLPSATGAQNVFLAL